MSHDQRTAVRRTLSAGSPAQCLELPSSYSRADVRRAYKFLARLLHPDKNPLPEAERAFKKLGAAFRTLIAELVDDPAAESHDDPRASAPVAPATAPSASEAPHQAPPPAPPQAPQGVGQGYKQRNRLADRKFHVKAAPAPTPP